MNGRETEKLYKELAEGAAPEYWDRIEAKLRPHAELTEEEKNAFSGADAGEKYAEILTIPAEHREQEGFGIGDDAGSGEETGADTGSERRAAGRSGRTGRTGRSGWAGWIAAAAVLAVLVPAALYGFLTIVPGSKGTGSVHHQAAATTAAAAEMVAGAEAPDADSGIYGTAAAAEAAAAENASDLKTNAVAGVPAETEAAESEPQKSGELLLLSVPENAVTVPVDETYFSEELLAETELLAACHVESAEFEADSSGRAYRITYLVTVRDSLLEDGVSGEAGSSIRVCSPIVSSASADGKVLYQLIPGADYILPLKRSGGDWELLCPNAPQIRMEEDGSFVFHTGYQELLNEGTEVVYLDRASEDDFYFDRMVSRSDPEFREELVRLIKILKNNAETP